MMSASCGESEKKTSTSIPKQEEDRTEKQASTSTINNNNNNHQSDGFGLGSKLLLVSSVFVLFVAVTFYQYDNTGDKLTQILEKIHTTLADKDTVPLSYQQVSTSQNEAVPVKSLYSESREDDTVHPGDEIMPPEPFKPEISSSTITSMVKKNSVDKKIRGKLSLGEQLLEADKLEDAERMFRKLVDSHPLSPLAHYCLGRTLNKQAERERSNTILDEAITMLGRAMTRPDIPDELFRDIALFRADRQSFRGRKQGTVDTLSTLLERFPGDLDVMGRLGVAHLHREHLQSSRDEARKIFEEMLVLDPGNGFALAHLGFMVQNHDRNPEKAAPLLVAGLNSGDTRITSDSRFYYHAGDALYRIGKREQAEKIFQQGADQGVFRSPKQRSLYNVQKLTARPWWELEQFPQSYQQFFKVLADNWEKIRDEGLAQIDTNTGLFKSEDENLRESGEWKQFTLFQKGQRMKECNHAPETCRLVSDFPDAAQCKRGQVKFSLLFPGTHVWPHCGATNCRLRPHLGLKIPGGAALTVAGETRTWSEGKFIILDDSFEHEVWHNGTEQRLILIVDVWHPELTAGQKMSLSPV